MSAILKFIRENHILAIIEQAIVKKKSKLHLNAFDIQEIPNLLYNCLEVEHLYLHRNKIVQLPLEISLLLNLTTLTLDYNSLSSLPPEIRNLKNLVNLNLSHNPLKVLIPEICELENLEAFWCNKTELRELPDDIGNLTKLDTFGARGNEIKTLPSSMGKLVNLRWLTLENNQIELLPDTFDKLEALIHCNLKNNRIREFPVGLLSCADLMFLQLNENQISSLPEGFDTSQMGVLEVIDLRKNPICELTKPNHPLVRYADDMTTTADSFPDTASMDSESNAAGLAIMATQIRMPPHNNPHTTPHPVVALAEMEMDAASVESSEDWENSVNSSELDMQYHSDDDRADNEAVGMVLPELSRYASTAS